MYTVRSTAEQNNEKHQAICTKLYVCVCVTNSNHSQQSKVRRNLRNFSKGSVLREGRNFE